MPYRTNELGDPETMRPTVQGFWRKISYKHSGFINLCSERWFRETCGGVWLHAEHYYNEAVNHHSELVKGASGLGAEMSMVYQRFCRGNSPVCDCEKYSHRLNKTT